MFEESKQYHTKDILWKCSHGSGITVTIRQLASNEPITGGNKWYKLKYNLLKAKSEGKQRIITFGGAFSNHIAATARVGKNAGFETIGIIRGEESSANNITLSRAKADGMKLIFVSRAEYKKKYDSTFIAELINDYDQYFVIPEGGANSEGVEGCKEILTPADEIFEHVIVSCGTGTTAAGIILSLKPHQKLTGISVLNDKGFLEKDIMHWLRLKSSTLNSDWKIIHDYHFGGYAKKNEVLNQFCDSFNKSNGIDIEPVYTGKMFFAIQQLVQNNYFKDGSKILAIHTGGLQYLMR